MKKKTKPEPEVVVPVVVAEAPAPEVTVKTKAQQYLEDAKKFVIASDADNQKAIDTIKAIKELTTSATKDRDLLLDPAKATVTAINNRWKPGLKFLEESEQLFRDKVNKYADDKDAAALAELNKLNNKVQNGAISRPDTIARKTEEIKGSIVSKNIFTGSASATNTKIGKLEIVDRNLIPDEYWIIDEVKLRKDVVDLKKEVAGAKVVYKNSVTII